jgi:hypothetical protein
MPVVTRLFPDDVGRAPVDPGRAPTEPRTIPAKPRWIENAQKMMTLIHNNILDIKEMGKGFNTNKCKHHKLP